MEWDRLLASNLNTTMEPPIRSNLARFLLIMIMTTMVTTMMITMAEKMIKVEKLQLTREIQLHINTRMSSRSIHRWRQVS